MNITYPKSLEKIVIQHLQKLGFTKSKIPHEKLDDRSLQFFSKGIGQLSDLFTQARTSLKSDYLNQPAFRSAYLLYFLPINFAKAYFVFSQMPKQFWQQSKFRILDLGCGPATASLAFLYLLQEKNIQAEVEFHLVDYNRNILQDAQALLQHASQEFPHLKISVHAESQDIRRYPWKGKFDLVVLNHVLNEWVRLAAHERAAWLVSKLTEHLNESGLVALLEPALKRPTRELMAMRDHLLEESSPLGVLGPCLHQQSCPMLKATKNDWCHFYLNWQEPEYLKKIDRWIGNDNRFLKVAYLLIASKDFWKQELQHNPQSFRVVSNRMETRGKTELVLCGPQGRWKLTRFDRDYSDKNQEIERVQRGDLVLIPSFQSASFEIQGPLKFSKNSIISKI